MGIQKTRIVINGKEYSSFDQIPPEEQKRIREKMSKLSAAQVGKALLKGLTPLMSGRGADIPNTIIQQLMGNEGAEDIKLSFGAGSPTSEVPKGRMDIRAPGYHKADMPMEQRFDQSPTVKDHFEGSGRYALAAIMFAAALVYLIWFL